MPAVSRIGDAVSVHPCGGSNAVATGSGNVFANNIAVTRNDGTDTNTPHLFDSPPICVPHVTSLTSGSSNVFVNGNKVGRKGDTYSCGVSILAGSPNVFVNGQ